MSNPLGNLAQQFAAANPQLSNAPRVAGRPGVSMSTTKCGDAVRTVSAGGDLGALLMHPTFVPFQLTFRKLPDDGVYSATPNRQYAFELGAFTVPESMSLAVAEYRFRPYRLSGALPGDAVPLEEGRLSLDIAYDLNIDQYRKGNLRTQIIPQVPQTQQNAFSGTQGGGTIFTNPLGGSSQTIGSIPSEVKSGLSNFGDGLLTQSSKPQQGPEKFPFTFYAKAHQAVQMRVIVFNTIRIPLAFFEGVMSGYLMPQNTLESMLEGLAPCQ